MSASTVFEGYYEPISGYKANVALYDKQTGEMVWQGTAESGDRNALYDTGHILLAAMARKHGGSIYAVRNKRPTAKVAGGKRRRVSSAVSDVEQMMDSSLPASVRAKILGECPICQGTGGEPVPHWCSVCKGSGFGPLSVNRGICSACKGKPWLGYTNVTCTDCGGTGRISSKHRGGKRRHSKHPALGKELAAVNALLKR